MAELSVGHPGIPRQEQREQKLTSTVQTVHTPSVNEQPMDKATVGQTGPATSRHCRLGSTEPGRA